MKIELELDDNVYRVIQQNVGLDIDVAKWMSSALTQMVLLMATNPDLGSQITESASSFPEIAAINDKASARSRK